MLRNFQYLLLLMVLTAATGCNTINGASTGAVQDINDTWNHSEKADAWMQEHMW